VTTTIHISNDLLERIDQRARAMGTSRNRVIVAAIETSLGSTGTWPPELVRMLAAPVDRKSGDEVEKSLAVVRSRRVNRKPAPKL
jgi:predicted transcriptional regulator